MNRRKAIATLLGLPVLASAKPQSLTTERIAITIDGRAVYEAVLGKIPWPRTHKIETSGPDNWHKTYSLVKTGEYGSLDELKRDSERMKRMRDGVVNG